MFEKFSIKIIFFLKFFPFWSNIVFYIKNLKIMTKNFLYRYKTIFYTKMWFSRKLSFYSKSAIFERFSLKSYNFFRFLERSELYVSSSKISFSCLYLIYFFHFFEMLTGQNTKSNWRDNVVLCEIQKVFRRHQQYTITWPALSLS